MPINLKPNKNNDPNQKFTKKIDDLIEDAEIEAELEIERSIRYKNTRIVLISVVGISLLIALYVGIQDKPDLFTSLLSENEETAQAPESDTPKPIPFPLMPQNSLIPQNQSVDIDKTPVKEAETVAEEAKASPPTPQPAREAVSSPAPDRPAARDDSPSIEKTVAEAAKSPDLTPTDKAALMISKALAPSPSLSDQPQNTSKPKPPAISPNKNFYIQVGAFAVKSNADNLMKKLKAKGFSPFIEIKTGKSTKHTVYMSGFFSKESGASLVADLQSRGFNPYFVENGDNTFSLILGKFSSEAKAQALQKKLSQQGILTSLGKMRLDTPIYMVRLGAFGNKNLVEEQKARLNELGINQPLVLTATIKP